MAQAAPVTTSPLAAVTSITTSAPAPASPKKHKMTKAAKHEKAVALKIRKKAQKGKVLNFAKAWKVTHNWTILNRYVYGLRLGGGHAIAGKKSVAELQRLSLVNASADRLLAAYTCRGKTDFKVGIGYYRVRLNSCLATVAEFASIFIAASVSFVAAVLKVAAPLAVVAAVGEFLFTIGALELAICNRNKRGVKIY
ncbi:MAG: hypothetical protein ABWX96_09040, partial [Propionibacteriaceae bacterium]